MPYRRANSLILALLLSMTCMGAVGVRAQEAAAPDAEAGICKSESKTPEEITAYVRNLAAALRTIRSTARTEASCTSRPGPNAWDDARNLKERAVGSMESLGSDMVASVNDGLAFSNFESSARFYLDLVLDSEMPEGTERDHRLLRKQQESIQQAYKAVYAACSADVPLPEAVGEIPAGTTLSDALSRIMANQIRVMNYFRTTVVGDKSIASFPDKFILVEDDAKFRAAITTNYWELGQEACRLEGGFFENIKAAMQRIGHLGGRIGEAMADWDAAWDMLNNATSDEKNTMRISLRITPDEGINFSMGADLVADNKKRFNTATPALGVGEQLRNIGGKISDTMEVISSQYADTEEAIRQATHTEQIPRLLERLQAQKAIDTDIARDYVELRELIGDSNQVTDTNMGELLRMHATLVDISREISKAIPLAEKACQDQATGLGQCKY